ncbi:hypothetical protein GCK32_010609 [Trichostrongylus colubriformis]|uniref:VWFA domain-containing protein n=1 Tax=Trichostrongylus colubriformis TaxID=6319 RepID=A0AAN8IKN8_TRICO
MLTMGYYSTDQLREAFDSSRKPFYEGMTGLKEALDIARDVLENQGTEGKAVIIMSDGGASNCHFPSSIPDETVTAEKMRDLGIRIIWVTINSATVDNAHIQKILGTSNYYRLNDPFQMALLNEFCVK